ncbi:MAG: laccase domain-containing protein, partial [Dokdonella sp.]
VGGAPEWPSSGPGAAEVKASSGTNTSARRSRCVASIGARRPKKSNVRRPKALRVPPARVQAWLGPAIGAASYEVGEEVRSAFVDADAQAASAFAPTRAGHWHCDLAALARQRLAGAGVGAVSGGGYDTLGDPRFYSFRRERSTGRFATLIWRES